MKNILIPTNLDEFGEFAYSIASQLAAKMNASITLLSVIESNPSAILDDNGNLIDDGESDYSDLYNERDQRKEALIEWAKDKTLVNSMHSAVGNVNQVILSFIENNDIELVVMGTRGIWDWKDKMVGSHTEYIANHSRIPVLSLKCDRSNLTIKEFLFVSDFHQKEKLNFTLVNEIAAAFDAKIIMLYINRDNSESQETILSNMQNCATVNEFKNFEFQIYNDKSIEHGVSRFCQERNIDLIILGSSQQKGIASLFKNSVSKDIVNHLFHPVITFPF